MRPIKQKASSTVSHGVAEAEKLTWLETHGEKSSYGVLLHNFIKMKQNPFRLLNKKVIYFNTDLNCKYNWEIDHAFQLGSAIL